MYGLDFFLAFLQVYLINIAPVLFFLFVFRLFSALFSVLGMFYYVSFSGPKIFSIPDFVLFPGIFTLCLDCFSIMTCCVHEMLHLLELNVLEMPISFSSVKTHVLCQKYCFVSKAIHV